ncbi:MAG: hypothetical protein K8H88_03395, partial [Sandaracinaceae bacterium]|nr:hypothetical protein [Sandaracinaceae bacterium]
AAPSGAIRSWSTPSTSSRPTRTPLGGRYYARPSPSAQPFVREGDVLEGGETVALIEVMKTFNRVQITGVSLPARVLCIVPKDGDDIAVGDVLLELTEP